MYACPSCAAPLDDDGICTACGALSRGFFLGLDLGTPQIADAVARGLDFYLLLGVTPATDLRAIARRYRQLRTLFPDNPAGLRPEPARRLALLEAAGRVLTDPRLRRIYDDLRSRAGVRAETTVLRCVSCSAPLPQDAARCTFCGTPRPAEAAAPTAPAPPGSDPVPTEPVDYYALIGLTPQHLIPEPERDTPVYGSMAEVAVSSLQRNTPPDPQDVDQAALKRQRDILLTPGLPQQERDARLTEIEIARRILRSERSRNTYDMVLLGFWQGLLGSGRLDTLRYLQDLARAEIAEERGEQLSEEVSQALLRQGIGFLDARLPREALPLLERALKVLPQSAEGHSALVRAQLAADDPLALGGHALRQLLRSLDALDALGRPLPNSPALRALCQGLLARDADDRAAAEAGFQEAVRQDSQLEAAWRGLAALALGRGAVEEGLGYSRRALALNPRDERVLLMMAAACLRARRRQEAYEVAAQIAAVRGQPWTAERVLRELEV
ncbi:MAG TPA: molecular chaperone DnaJ [Roseiflexaceae bacterium]|nr:molecular chaperone DnaJ [Roseiflexaceae bacterium]